VISLAVLDQATVDEGCRGRKYGAGGDLDFKKTPNVPPALLT